MIELYDVASNRLIGTIAEPELKILVDTLEEESSEDQDYYIDQPTIELLATRGASENLLNVLRTAVGSADGVEIRWQRR
jgi:hypothetical protein